MDAFFLVARSLRVPGLGLLVLPAPPAPDWLTHRPLHSPLWLRLHRPGQPAQAVVATLEEISHDGGPAGRALLLDADPAGPVGPGAWLVLQPDEPDGLH